MDKDKIKKKINDLLRLASNNPSEEEAEAALLKAQELMYKYHIENTEQEDEEKVVTALYSFGNYKPGEFALMLSVVVANNFRSKTAHHNNMIYFFGFEEDATAARQVYGYILNYSIHSLKHLNRRQLLAGQSLKSWQDGFVYGLCKAFESRKGYELMRVTPKKVIEKYNSLKREKTYLEETQTKVDAAFLEGYRRGKESLDKREIEGGRT